MNGVFMKMSFKDFVKNQNYNLKEKELKEEDIFLQENRVSLCNSTYEGKEEKETRWTEV